MGKHEGEHDCSRLDGRGRTVRGTYEWAVATVNCSLGCPHDCRYCYARQKLVGERGLLPVGQWHHMRPLPPEQKALRQLYPGVVMFPSRHDIVPENLADCLRVLQELCGAGNQVLVVSKPHLSCIETLCRELTRFRQQVLFRFTITARNESLLRFWEPGAPLYGERLASLQAARNCGYRTSVSIEPILDMDDVAAMVHELLPFVSQTIWLGKMNKIGERVTVDIPEAAGAVARILAQQRDERILQLYRELSEIAQIRWKESIKEVAGLALANRPGLDI
jgi:DNA repair photolyase